MNFKKQKKSKEEDHDFNLNLKKQRVSKAKELKKNKINIFYSLCLMVFLIQKAFTW